MDLREIRTFVTVADLGTVSKAAELLHISQPRAIAPNRESRGRNRAQTL